MRYHGLTVTGQFDPLPLVTRLVSASLFDPYVVYEQDGTWSFAGGALGDVRLERGKVIRRWGDDVHVTAWSPRPLDDVRHALAQAPLIRWKAYGWLAFEYAYLRAGLTGAEDQALLRLILPHTEVRLSACQLAIRSVSRTTAEQVRDLLDAAEQAPSCRACPVDVHTGDAQSYQTLVGHAVQEIRDGGLQKVILSRRVPVGFPVDLARTYLLGRSANNPARSFIVHTPGLRAVGFSPETVLETTAAGRISTNPLAGTRALHGTAQDADLRAALMSDPKEIYEHAISVKLAFDEFTSLCMPGSVVVDELMAIKNRGSVQHISSRITGLLPAHRGCWDALDAVFPAVTASGIPKARAYECITRLESQPRCLYAGAVIAVHSDGSLDAAVALRALFEKDGKTWLQAGAGIVAASDPAREYAETCEKLRSIAPYIVARGNDHEPADLPVRV